MQFKQEILPLLQALLRKLFDIREGEGVRAALMMIYIFLIITTLLIVKPVTTSLFLSEFGADQLPNAFILVAIFAMAGSAFYSRYLKKTSLHHVIEKTLQIAIIALLIFWSLLFFNYLEGWVLYAFYTSVAIFAVVATSQFWILANLSFNPREARRLFGFIGAGAIAGGIFGGYLTNFLAPVIGSENLILCCTAILFCCIVIAKKIWHETTQHRINIDIRQKEQLKKISNNAFKLIIRSRHLTFLASIVAVGVLVGKLVEYQFSAIASMKITDEDQLTAFFGFWLSNLNIASLVIQLLLTRRIVGVFGVGTSLFILPGALFFGALAILVSPALWSAIAIKITDGSLKNSLNKAGLELLALPIPIENKNQTKSFIDVFVDSFATGIGGILLAIITIGLGVSVRVVSVVIVALIIFWIYLVNRVRAEYLNAFRLKIEAVEPKSQTKVDLEKESVLQGLIKTLQGSDEKQILKVLKMTRQIQKQELLPCFRELIAHPNRDIRLQVLRNLSNYKKVDFVRKIESLIYDSDFETKTEAFHYLFKHNYYNRMNMLQNYLHHQDRLVRGAALLCAARESRNNEEMKKIFHIQEEVESEIKKLPHIEDEKQARYIKIICARIIGAANIPDLFPYLHIFLRDQSQEILREAVLAAGQSRNRDFIPVLIGFLENDELSEACGKALQKFGPEIIDPLAEALSDSATPQKVRLAIPTVLANIKTQQSADVLIATLEHKDQLLRYETIKALNNQRKKAPHLRFAEGPIIKTILDEAQFYTRLLGVLYTQTRNETAADIKDKQAGPDTRRITQARKNLIELLESRLDHNLERIFRLLGLKYPPDDIYNVYLGIKSSEPDLRLNAVEFLDNVLDPGLKRTIIPLVETVTLDSIAEETLDQIGMKDADEFEYLSMILTGRDDQLKVRALELIGGLQDDKYVAAIGKLINSRDANVRKAAESALQEMNYLT